MSRSSLNLAGRAGRWSAEHWKSAVFGWLAFVALALAMGHFVGLKKQTDADSATGGAARAERILEQAGFQTPASESVLVQSRTLTTASPSFRAAVQEVVATLHAQPAAYEVRSPLSSSNHGQVSRDGHSALVQYQIHGRMEDSPKRIAPVLDAIAKVQKANPSLYVADFGYASATRALNDTVGKDFQRAEFFSLPLTLLLSLIHI